MSATSDIPLNAILEHADVGIAQLETSGRYLLVNDRYCRMVKRSRRELLDSRLQDITYPDDLSTSLDAFIQTIETGVPRIISHRYQRDDTVSAWISHTVSPAYDDKGNPQFVLVLAHEAALGTAPEQATSDYQSDLRILLDAAADGFFGVDCDGKTTLCNAALLRMLGFEREEDVIGRDLLEVVKLARDDGTLYSRADCPIYKATQSGTAVHMVDEIIYRNDGSHFPVEYSVRPVLRDGQIRGAVCTFVDLSARKQAEERQELLNRELAHRVKNTLAMVQAIVGQTLRMSPTPQQALKSIDGRLVALSEAHTVLTRTRWGNASIVDIVESAVAPHRAQAHRIQINGPRLDLGSKAALALTLALHELGTNAAKYGALSNDAGTVAIDWSVTGGAADAGFHLTWKETGGPPVSEPEHKGFGSRMIAERFGSDFGGRASLRFEPDGVLWTLEAPLSAMRE